MNGQKIHLSKPNWGLLKSELKFLGCFLTLITFSNFVFSNNTFALFFPTLSASVDNTAASVNGNQVINSANKTTEIPLNLTVSTNNKTGYTAILNSETNETALVNNDSANGVKINSISTNLSLNNLPNNTWGYKFGASSNYAPIPALSTPVQILQTTGKTNGNESSQLSIGMKLSDNLESGRYINKLIFSILTNNYNRIAIMTEGPDFNTKLKALETATNKIEHFKKSPMPPVVYMNTVTIDDEESDYEIKLWLDPTDKTAYYYAETEKVYLNEDSSMMFFRFMGDENIKNILDIDLSSFDTSMVTDMRSMFANMHNITTLNLSNFNTSKVTDMAYMFNGMHNLITFNLSSFDTSRVVDMSNMFYSMYALTNLNLSNFNTTNVTNMGFMFFSMYSLTSLDLSSFDTSNVANMSYMFYGMYGLTSLNLSSFNTSHVTDMSYMFIGISNLISLNLSSFNTSQVTGMSFMFSGMTNLISLDLSSFDTSNVTSMSNMFSYMPNLISLNLSNFNTSQVTSMASMFSLSDIDASNDKLEKIYVNNDFNTSKLTSYSRMFDNRKKLRGGNGSYLNNPSTADKTWLRIDDPVNGRPGYFTRKP
ncbi:BspA family leucine-rich repeat surface protein [Candidatus Saccharibacteria bacterium]|nr:BspA family leucine-rich repeat surface protein [Candidatus Saccharibacteria bacterium]